MQKLSQQVSLIGKVKWPLATWWFQWS